MKTEERRNRLCIAPLRFPHKIDITSRWRGRNLGITFRGGVHSQSLDRAVGALYRLQSRDSAQPIPQHAPGFCLRSAGFTVFTTGIGPPRFQLHATSVAGNVLPQNTSPASNYLRHAQSLFGASKQTRIAKPSLGDDVEVLRASVKTGALAQTIVAIAAAIGLIYFLKTVLITILISMLLAFVLDPLVVALARCRVPRPVGAFLAMFILFALAAGLSFFFYYRALDFADQIPRYSSSIREVVRKVEKQAQKVENTTHMILPEESGKKPLPVQVKDASPLARMISAGAAQFGEVALAISFIPFLVYFMLTWKSHVHAATLHLLPQEHRAAGYRTIGRLSEMVRAFIVGNLMVALINSVASTILFWSVGLPYFYFIGAISAFVGLIPYLGVFFALLVPIAAGLGTLTKGQLGIVILGVTCLHVLTMNLLYPKLIGRRLRLNPLAVALSLLFWAWVWGPIGLILAVPLVGTTKIVCDFIEPLHGLAEWLGD